MYMLLVLGINVVIAVMTFGVYAKLGELTRAVERLTPQTSPAQEPSTPPSN